MDYPTHTTNACKHKHLNYQERVIIQVRLNDDALPYKIAKELRRASNTIRNEIKRGTVSQIKQGKLVKVDLADAGDAIYKKNCENCCSKYKRLKCIAFINEYFGDQFREVFKSITSDNGQKFACLVRN